MTPNMVKVLNEQINFELYSAYLYMAMAAHFKSLNLPGFSHWMQIQTKEELAHALKMYNYLTERGAEISFDTINKPPKKWECPSAVFKSSYEHEQIVTSRINEIVDVALSEKDHTTSTYMQWFLNEQIEEEASALEIYQQLKLAENSPQVLLMLDRELAQRVFVDPNAPTGNQTNAAN